MTFMRITLAFPFHPLVRGVSALLACSLMLILPARGLAMGFEMQERCIDVAQPRCQQAVLAQGQIDSQTVEQFKAFSKNLPRGTWIALTSPGGLLGGGLKLGEIIRERGFNTTIGYSDFSPNSCLSSCAYAFMGGNIRYLPAGAKYGLHQFRGTENELGASTTQKLSAIIANYADVMGVDRRVIDIAQLTAADRVSILTPSQAKLYKIDNVGQSTYPRWRIEASANGQLLALNAGVIAGTNLVVTLAFTPVQQTIVFVVFYRTTDAQAFSTPTPHELQLTSSNANASALNIKLTPLGEWQFKTSGYQASFQIPPAALEALSQAPQDSTLLLTANFTTPPAPLAKGSAVQIRMGIAGLNNALQAIAQNALNTSPKKASELLR